MFVLAADAAQSQTAAPWWQLLTLVGFGLLILIIFGVVRILTANTKMGFTAGYSRTMGLITLAMLAVVLAATNAPSEVKTGAFTLLGTIAGFFIGDRSQDKRPRTDAEPDATRGGGRTPDPDED